MSTNIKFLDDEGLRYYTRYILNRLDDQTISETVKNLYNLPASASSNELFEIIYNQLQLLRDKQCQVTINFKIKNGTSPLAGVYFDGVFDAKGNAVKTDENGVLTAYAPSGTVMIGVSGYADVADGTTTYTFDAGGSYTLNWNGALRTYRKYTSSTKIRFSPNCNLVDFTLAGGGGGGGAGKDGGGAGGGGGGGYCNEYTGILVEPNVWYQFVAGAGGARGRNSDGGAGGSSSFLEKSADGGKGGMMGNSNGNIIYGGSGNGAGGNGDRVYMPSGATALRYIAGTSGSAGENTFYASFTDLETSGGGGGGGGATVAGTGTNAGYHSGHSGGSPNGGKGGTPASSSPTSPVQGSSIGGGGGGAFAQGNYSLLGATGGDGGLGLRMHLIKTT